MTVISFNAVDKFVGDLFGRRQILRNLTFELPTGSVCGLVGHNGAGKSTLISLATGLAKPTAGTVLLNGIAPTKQEGRRGLGFAAEHPAFPATLTAKEMVELHLHLLGKKRGDGDELLEELGLARTTQRIGTWSKGMRQRLALALAMLDAPGLLILDEPMSGLDPVGRAAVRKAILDERARGATVLFSSHVLSDIAAVCNHLLVLRGGVLVLDERIGETSSQWVISTQAKPAELGGLGADVVVNDDGSVMADPQTVWTICQELQRRGIVIGSVQQQALDLERRVLPLLETTE